MSHVAIVIPGLDRIAGAERQAMLLSMGLRRRGWRVTVVALSGTGGQAVAELQGAGVGFVSLEMRKGLADPRGWIRFHRWLKHVQPDVVHAHLPHAAWMARWSRLAAGVPVVIDTLHSSFTGRLGRRIGYRCSRWMTDYVTAVSHAAAAAHVARRMVSESKVSVVANGIDVDAWRRDESTRMLARRELGLGKEFLWIAVGRLEPVKDYPTLLKAMANGPENAQLVVFGQGPLDKELVALVGQLGLKQRVRFLGFEPNVRRWMQAADGVVLTSLYEGLPMVLLEAGACGLPAVATDVPGTREVIVNGETGWLTRPGDVLELAHAMARVMRVRPEARRAMGERALQRVVQHFSMEVVLDQWEMLYEDLLAEKNADMRIRLATRESLTRQSAESA